MSTVKQNQKHSDIEHVSLSFRDRNLERSFGEIRFQNSRSLIRGACALGALLIASFAFLDEVFVPADVIGVSRALHFLVIIPSLLAALLITYLTRSHVVATTGLAVAISLVGLMWTVLLILAGPDTTIYYFPKVIMTLLFALFMLGLPFRIGAPLAWGISLVHIATTYLAFSEISAEQLLASAFPILAICAIATYAAYQINMTSRQLYLQSVALRAEQAAREDADNARLDWLENMARFLRHELRNTIIGISSSLELLKFKGVDLQAQVYIDRALRSVTYMRKLVNDSSEATALELSLEQDQPNPVELSSWLHDQVEVYRQSYEGRDFKLEIVTRALVATTEERITQLLDKLVSNAIEHAHPDSPIELRLEQDGADALLSVADQGDPLPENKDGIFGLFSTTKSDSSHENIGLGLHIAKLIAEAHGGSIRAVDLHDPIGARFEVRLPIGYFNMRNRAGRRRSDPTQPRPNKIPA